MAKKRFTDNFDSLFGDPMEELQPEKEETNATGKASGEHPVQTDEDSKKAGGKDFTDSLQSFLSETFEASFEKHMAEAENKKKQAARTSRKPRRRRSGLDMLIRSTVEPSKIEIEEGDQPRRRRITLTFEPQKLEKLKNIAKVEKAMLKDIINDIVGEYIRQYEIEKGNNL